LITFLNERFTQYSVTFWWSNGTCNSITFFKHFAIAWFYFPQTNGSCHLHQIYPIYRIMGTIHYNNLVYFKFYVRFEKTNFVIVNLSYLKIDKLVQFFYCSWISIECVKKMFHICVNYYYPLLGESKHMFTSIRLTCFTW
jgi:hypothetical protein